MPQHDDRSLLMRAESLVEAAIPGSRAARVPTGLFMVLPVRWNEGDLVCLTLTSREGRLTLRAGDAIAAALLSEGAGTPGSGWQAALAAHGLVLDVASRTLAGNVAGIDALPARATSIGSLLGRLHPACRDGGERLLAA